MNAVGQTQIARQASQIIALRAVANDGQMHVSRRAD
jgi:hypothetical protein